MKNTKDKIPADANWNQVISEVSDLINESRDKKNELATEVIAQAKRITRRWFTAWVITLVALIAVSYTHLTLPTKA